MSAGTVTIATTTARHSELQTGIFLSSLMAGEEEEEEGGGVRGVGGGGGVIYEDLRH